MKKILSFLFVLLTSLTFAQNSATTSINNNIVSQGTKGITATKLTSALNAIVSYVGSPAPKRLTVSQVRLLSTDYPVMVYVTDIDGIFTLDASDVSSSDDGVNVIVAASGGKRYKKTLSSKADINSPSFTGTPTLPTGTIGVTQTAGNSTTALATTAFVTTADNLKANIASPTFTGTPTLPTGTIGVTQTAGNSTTALATTAFVTTADNLKANIASPTFTGTPTLPTGTIGVTQTAGNSTTALATTAFVTTAVNLKANINSPTFTGTVGGINSSMVGLGNVDNTSDLNKPISTATQNALDNKENKFAQYSGEYGVLTSQKIYGTPAPPLFLPNIYWVNQYVDASNVDLQIALGLNSKETVIGNGTTSQYWRGDKTWQDLNTLPVSTATQTALNLKANLASPTFTGTVVLPATTSIGTVSNTELSYVDNVTSSIQTQLNSKESTLTFSSGLTRNTNTIRNDLVTGKQGGGLIYGDIDPNGLLNISSTINATKGKITFGTSAYDEANNRFGIGNFSPSYTLDVNGISQATQYKLSALNTAPASATATGVLGEIRVTATYIYVCTATNTWVRSALATW